jgi:hypothetical protein
MVHGSIRIEQQRALEDFDQLQCHVQADRNHVGLKDNKCQELGGDIMCVGVCIYEKGRRMSMSITAAALNKVKMVAMHKGQAWKSLFYTLLAEKLVDAQKTLMNEVNAEWMHKCSSSRYKRAQHSP